MSAPAGDTHPAALAWHEAGCCVLPARLDGSKAAALPEWKSYQATRPTTEQIKQWFGTGHPGMGIVCGQASGNLEMLELEGRAVAEGQLQQLIDLLTATGLDKLWQQATTGGYVEWTPGGGMHVLYRVDGAPVPGNTKLAQRPARPDEYTDDERRIAATRPDKAFTRVLAETRGEGGWVVVAPSSGPTHPTGRAWTAVYGSPATIPTITAGQREQLLRIVRCLDRTPAAPEPVSPPRPALPRDADTLSPGDDFEAKTTWADLLRPHGWTLAYTQGRTSYWRRPGKTTPGISATTGHAGDRDRLYVFSSSTPFDPERPYTMFGAYAVLEHNGDHAAAARALRAAGYGSPPEAHAATFADLIPPRPAAAPEAVPAAPDAENVPAAAQPEAEQEPIQEAVETREPTTLERLRAALIRSSQLDDIPEPEPLISDILYRNSIAWLIGPPGNGKSFVAIDMAGCVSCGEIWQGYRATKGDVLYLIAEGVSGIKQRVRAWESAMGQPMNDVQFLPVAVQSANEDDWSAFVQLSREIRPALIVIDTQARVTVGMEENSAKDMGEFVHRVERLRVASGACVLVVHHQGRSGDHMRGSTALEGAATTIIKVAKDEDSVEVECMKQKDAPEFDKINLRLVSHDSSAILSPTGHELIVHIGHPAVQRMLTDWWNSHETDWVSVTTLVESKITAKSTFHRSKKPLERAGLVEVKGEGGARRYRLSRQPPPP